MHTDPLRYEITATYDVITPMFLDDADPSAFALRPTTIKGALRFWWRAMHWAASRGCASDDEQALRRLHTREVALFGGVASGDAPWQGQANVLLKISHCDCTMASANSTYHQSGTPPLWQQYLLGLGLYKQGKGLARTACVEGSFTVSVLIRPVSKERGEEVVLQDLQEVTAALELFGLVGGLGTRSRHGFGSVSLRTLTVTGEPNGHRTKPIQRPRDATQYGERLTALIGSCWQLSVAQLPPFSAFSSHARVDILPSDKSSALEVLNTIGKQMLQFRGNGVMNRKTGRREANDEHLKGWFRDDLEIEHKLADGIPQSRHPSRAVFGLLAPVHFSTTHQSVELNATGEAKTRRASPLLIHIARLANDQYLMVHTFLKARALPDEAQIGVKLRGSKKSRSSLNDIPCAITDTNGWQPITDYLNSYATPANRGRTVLLP